MTDDDKVLAARIRKEVCNCHICGLCGWKPKRAANRIEELSAENERLREALGWFLNDSRFVVQVGGNPYVVPQMIEEARARLGLTE